MLSYVNRRKKWWTTSLPELDPEVRLSETTRANLLVELPGLSRPEQLMVKTVASSETVAEYARVLTQHHAQVHMREKLLSDRELGASYPTTGPWPQSPNRPGNLPRDSRTRPQPRSQGSPAHIADGDEGYDEDEQEELAYAPEAFVSASRDTRRIHGVSSSTLTGTSFHFTIGCTRTPP